MERAVTADRIAALIGDFPRSPAYAGLADALIGLIGDGRVPERTRLPSERELCPAVGLSRTTVTRAYAVLVERGYAAARRGSGTFTRVPGGVARAHDRALMPRSGDHDAIDLNCAAPSAPPGLGAVYAEAAAEMPAYLGGHGYFPAGLPRLQAAIAATYDARGLATRPEQILVTPGALSATAIVARAHTGAGDRVLVESPIYPNAVEAVTAFGARPLVVPVDPDSGWDLDLVRDTLRRSRPRLAYLIPDFQNPTGHVMSEEQRDEVADALRGSGTTAVIDEAHQALELDGRPHPRPFARFASTAISIGSASKAGWGGLRLGWIRAPQADLERLVAARVCLDLGTPVLEQLVLARLLEQPGDGLAEHRTRLRAQRDALTRAVSTLLPDWTFRIPSGGLVLWCRLPAPLATAVAAEAERRGVILAPGPVFAVEGGLDRYLRIPWTRPAIDLEEAVRRLASAWTEVRDRHPRTGPRDRRILVA